MSLDFGKLDFDVSLNLTAALPLDARCYFETYDAAKAAAESAEEVGSTNTIYYYGQVLVVVEKDIASLYIIQPNNELKPLGSSDEDFTLSVNENQFKFDENGNLTLVGYESAQSGQILTLNSNKQLIWSDPIDTYTKNEIDAKIASSFQLKRVIVKDTDEIINDYFSKDNFDNYVFMVPTGLETESDKYDEYIILEIIDNDNISTRYLEKVGSWDVELTGYATKEDLEKKADIVYFTTTDADGNVISTPGEFLSPDDKEKLRALVVDDNGNVGLSGKVNADNVSGLNTWLDQNGNKYIKNLSEENLSSELIDKIEFITAVDTNNFEVKNGELKLSKIISTQIEDLDTVLGSKASTDSVLQLSQEVKNLSTIIETLNSDYVQTSIFNSTVEDLTSLINTNKANIDLLSDKIDSLDSHLTWQRLE